MGVVGVLGCGGPHHTLHILSAAPTAQDHTQNAAPLHVKFDRPVADEDEVGKPLDAPPVRVLPQLALRAHFADRQTLILTPTAPLLPATRYQVVFIGDLAERLPNAERQFSFVHDPLHVVSLTGLEPTWVATQPTFELTFSHPVAVADVVRGCAFYTQPDNRKVDLVSKSNHGASKRVALTTTRALKKAQRYTLRCSGVRTPVGNAPLDPVYEAALLTYPDIGVASFAPQTGQHVPPDELLLRLRFSTPVTLEKARAFIELAPAAKGLSTLWVPRGDAAVEATVTLEAETDYVLTVKKGLEDRFGQKLKKDQTFYFSTSNAKPSISMETGIFAIEAVQGQGFPVWSRNVNALDVTCAPVPEERLVKLLTSSLEYDPWYDAKAPQLDWKQFGLNEKTGKITIANAKNKWNLSRVAMQGQCGGKRARGLYLMEVGSDEVKKERTYGQYPYRVLGNVTDLGLLMKVGPASGLVWVTSLSKGQPAAGATVRLYDLKGKRVFQGKTDAQGLLRTPGTTTLSPRPPSEGGEGYDWDRQRLIAVAQQGEDVAVLDGNWANGIQIYNFGVPSERMGGTTRIRGFLETDRGIYRPGETVFFKGLVREVSLGESPRIPQGVPVDVRVEDARGVEMLRQRLALTRFGGFALKLALTKSAALGDYHISAKVRGQLFRESFSVESFRPVAFEIRSQSPRQVQLGEQLKFAFSTDYLFGAPVSDAEATWSVERRPRDVHFARFAQYNFRPLRSYEDWWSDTNTSFVADGSATTDDKGRFSFAVKDPAKDIKQTQDYLVRTTVKDETDQSVSKQVVVTAHRSSFYLGLHAQEWVQAVNMPFKIHAVAVDTKGTQVARDATLRFIKRRWVCADSEQGYRYASNCHDEDDTVWTRKVSIPATGVAMERILPKIPGEFMIELQAKDEKGQTVEASMWVWVLGPGEAFWSGDESSRVPLIANKTLYEAGETARLVPRVDAKDNLLLVTLERNGILDARVERASTSSYGVEVALKEAHAPNVFVSVAMVKGRTGPSDKHRPSFRMGVSDLKLSTKSRELQVTITTERPNYEPGQIVRGAIAVTSRGKPVQVELALSAADEGVLQLIDYKTPDPMKTFYASFGLGVENSTNLNRIARLSDPIDTDDDEEGMDSGDPAADRIRSRFLASAYWNPTLVTDKNGRAVFSFTAPDNLTAFRLMAVAADAQDKFGSAEKRITVSKKLLLTPVLPRFFTEGDQGRIGVVVHNYSQADGEVVVKAGLKGLSGFEGSQRIFVKAQDKKRVEVPFTATAQAQAQVQFTAQMGALSDGLRMMLPINRPMIHDKQLLSEGKLEGVRDIPVKWPKNIIAENSVLEISADNTGLAGLEESLRYLIQYPYGCLEQTLSRLIPLFKVLDLAKSLNLKALQGPKLDTYIREGLEKILRQQDGIGHFSLWPNGQGEAHLTAYALLGLNEAKRAGLKVDGKALDKAAKALRVWANDKKRGLGPNGETATMAMAAYVLAEFGQLDSGLNHRLYEARAGLPVYGKAFLLRALHKQKAKPAMVSTLQKEIVGTIQTKNGSALVRETYNGQAEAFAHYMSSDTRSSAIVASALIELNVEKVKVDQLVVGLKASRLEGGRWGNTQENIYGLMALADYSRAQDKGKRVVTAVLSGKKVWSTTLQDNTVARYAVTLDKALQGTLKLETSGPAFIAVRLSFARKLPKHAATARGLQLERAYYDMQTNKPVTSAEIGQLIRVRLNIKTDKPQHYIALIDQLPAGCEAINTKLATSQQVKTAYTWTWDHQEMHDDRVMAFANWLGNGGSPFFEYVMRATLPGTFMAPPATIEAMYEPTTFGRTNATTMTIAR